MRNRCDHTFIILAYKESPYLEECILSLQRQAIKSNILISTSTPSFFLNNMSKRFRVPLIINNNSNGIASDWSFAYEKAQTKYVTLAHQDDLYLSEYSRLCLEAADRCKNTLFVFTDYCELFGYGPISFSVNLFIKRVLLMAFLFKKEISSPLIKRYLLSFGSPISCPGVMYNKENIGAFKFSDNFLVSLDWDTWLRLSQKKGSFVYVNRRLIYHRIYKESEGALQTRINRRKQEDEVIFARLWPKPIAKMLASLYCFSYKFTDKKIH